ncbi:response regulator [Clostridium sp. ZS2-4]|uniref:response regulator n=1 Tax=Clostridium sp. ZS2-4 TaxID=2987703 RepID=UPI00227B6119|nr:response regulator [Clostridium sp. ZS2-4]MCY6354923.1 response regulator [Clostridium sp. ZS2-4]
MDIVKVLFVDDEVHILNSINRSVIDEDYSSFFAVSGEKALEIIQDKEISVLVTDMKMPNMNGLELLKKVKEISPNTIRMVLSGYTQLPQVLATVNSVGIFKFITKPWKDDEEFLPSIREAIDYYTFKKESSKFKKELQNKNLMYKNMLNYNNDILKNINIDMNNLKKINKLILSFEKNLFDKIKSNQVDINLVDYYIDLINSIYFDFLNTLPSKNEKFSLEQLANTLKSDILHDLQIEIVKPDFVYEGNYTLIITTIKTLLKQILKKCTENEFEIIINQFNPLKIDIKFNKENFHEIVSKDLDLKLTIKVLNEINTTVGENFNINIEDNSICVNINFSNSINIS